LALDQQQDPAAFAARVIGDESLSIFQAVEAAMAEMDARARREADEIVRRTADAIAPARARLETMSRLIERLSTELDKVSDDSMTGRPRGS
jgi:hypothetical protein